jgi:hypothetical protein
MPHRPRKIKTDAGRALPLQRLLNYAFDAPSSSGSLAMLTAIRRASSFGQPFHQLAANGLVLIEHVSEDWLPL